MVSNLYPYLYFMNPCLITGLHFSLPCPRLKITLPPPSVFECLYIILLQYVQFFSFVLCQGSQWTGLGKPLSFRKCNHNAWAKGGTRKRIIKSQTHVYVNSRAAGLRYWKGQGNVVTLETWPRRLRHAIFLVMVDNSVFCFLYWNLISNVHWCIC